MGGCVAIKFNNAGTLKDHRDLIGRLPLQAALQISVRGSRIATHIPVSPYPHPSTIAGDRRRLRPSSEAEMVALFLRTELPSDRWRDDLRALLKRDGLPVRD